MHNDQSRIRVRVSDVAIRKMVYMPPAAARRLRKLAFDDERKESDLFNEAMRRYFEHRGIKDNDLWLMRPIEKMKEKPTRNPADGETTMRR
jgi:hypothetical protein